MPPATVRFNPFIDTMAQSAWGQGKLEQLQSSCAQKDFLRLVHLEQVPSSESGEAVKQLFCNGNNAGSLLSHFLRWPGSQPCGITSVGTIEAQAARHHLV